MYNKFNYLKILTTLETNSMFPLNAARTWQRLGIASSINNKKAKGKKKNEYSRIYLPLICWRVPFHKLKLRKVAVT
jgi:hypothetical protein